jgi:hypothetical protein
MPFERSEGQNEVQVWAVCSDDDGNRSKPIVRNARAQNASGDNAGPYLDTMQIGLPHGPYTWSIAVKDVPSGLTSYLVIRKEL